MQITKSYNGVPVEIYGSLGDLETFERLPEDVQKSILRLFRVDNAGEVQSGRVYTEDQMIEAYEAGFNDCFEQIVPNEPYLNTKDVRDWVRSLR